MPTNSNLFARDDTFLGVCEGLGEDFGVPPLILRLALAVLLFFSPVAVVAVYLGLGMVVLVSRLAFPVSGSVGAVAPVRAVANDDGVGLIVVAA